jgi:hypothetical protein
LVLDPNHACIRAVFAYIELAALKVEIFTNLYDTFTMNTQELEFAVFCIENTADELALTGAEIYRLCTAAVTYTLQKILSLKKNEKYN